MNPDPLQLIETGAWHAEPVRAAHHRRVGFLFGLTFGLILGALAVRAVYAATPRHASEPRWVPVHVEAPPENPEEGGRGANDRAPSERSAGGASTILDPFPVSPPPERAAVELPSPELRVVSKAPVAEGHSVTGTASWGDDWSGVVTRLPRGTAICVAGPLGRWCGASVGYGPAVWTGRIADLSRAVFGDICGPVSAGLCTVTVTW